MPVNVDELKTVLAVAGQQNYLAAMFAAARATTNLERTTVLANRRMGESTDAYFDKVSNRYRDAQSGQFLAKNSFLGGSWAMAAATVLAAESALLAGALRLAAGAFREVTTAGREFEATMKDVENQSGASADEMERIKEAALSPELQKLGVSGNAAAQAYKELASYGYDAAQMQAAMLSITQVAIATGSDQEAVTRAMLGVMNQYKLAITDMPAIANAFTAALNQTSFQMNDFMLAMKYAGPIAGSMGWSMGETAAVLDQLNKTFVNAEMSGTGFRGFMNTLLAPSVEAKTAFAEAGLNIEDFRQVMGDAGETLKWFQSGNWDSAKIMRAFGAEAGNAALVLRATNVPALEAATAAVNTNGNAAADAANKVNTLDGAVKKAAAAFENAKIRLSALTSGLATDFVNAVGLAMQAMQDYLTETRDQLDLTGSSLGAGRDRVLHFAEAFITGAAIVARGAIQISRYVALQAAQIANLVNVYNVARLAWLELGYAWAWVLGNDDRKRALSEEIDEVKRTIAGFGKFQTDMAKWAFLGGATAAMGEVDDLESKLLKKVRELRDKAIEEQRKAENGTGAPLPDKGNPTAVPDTSAANLDAAEEALRVDLKRLALWERRAKAGTTDAAQIAMIELAAREKELEIMQQMERLVYNVTSDEKKRRDASLAREESEIGVVEAKKKIAEEAIKLNEQERMKNAQAMDQLAKKGRAINDAVQMVIGGQLSQLARDQIARLSQARSNQGWLQSVRANNRTITLQLRPEGPLAEQQVEQVMNLLVPIIEQAGKRPAYGT